VCAAIARELAGFMWAVAREVQPAWRSPQLPRTGGGGTTAGEHPSDALWPAHADARCKIGSAPDA